MARVVVLGAGVMGLAAAYHAAKYGHQVTVLEADKVAGGMAAHFDLDGLDIERFYHFVCRTDRATFALLDELGLGNAVQWRPTSMGYFYDGRLHGWGDPLSLLRFPHLSLVAKFRYGLHAFLSMRRRHWRDLDDQKAVDWLRRWVGDEAYDRVWRKLMELKFHRFADNVSAAWIWARIRRAGQSRRNLFQEELGYIEGGSQTLTDRLVQRIVELGGVIHLSTPAELVEVGNGAVKGVRTASGYFAADRVVSTVPLPLIPNLIPDLPAPALDAYRRIANIGAICIVHKLRRRLSPHFWINVNDARMDVPGMIEFSNLRKMEPAHVVYIPYYLPLDHPLFTQADDALIERTRGYMKLINPELADGDFLAARVGRLRYAQPVCPPGFARTLPPVRSPIDGLQIADTSSYYPEDRGVSESVQMGRTMAEDIS
ncbi:NAD(P)/FAD-dependent oxidoreductase [Dongia sp.]|uniref:NAD(P)/FAD-dependent oxidoreductase n=1 Tax=Dongia sp. TaxID=1977262 RepID=UPI0035B29F62